MVPFLAWGTAAGALDQWGHRATQPGTADCIVVLGARVAPGGRAGLSLTARSQRAAQLYHDGAAPFVICTGGVGHNPPAESIVATNALVNLGVPRMAIYREEKSTSTWENANEAAALCKAHGWTRLIVVSDGYHLWRATRNFKRLGLDATPMRAADPLPVRRMWMSLREALSVARDAFAGHL